LKLASGTSDSAALVSGVAALLFARYPNATAAQVKQSIISSCARSPELAAPVTCGGVVNAAGALDALRRLLR
jgi:subtilisin family serine protease